MTFPKKLCLVPNHCILDFMKLIGLLEFMIELDI